jgi:hypothetical protein
MTTVLTLESVQKYPPFRVPAKDAFFLHSFLKNLIEERKGSVLASEAQTVGEMYTRIASYVQNIINNESKPKTNPKPKPTHTKTPCCSPNPSKVEKSSLCSVPETNLE